MRTDIYHSKIVLWRKMKCAKKKLAMGLSGYLVFIPAFSDSAIVIMSPVARALSARGGILLVALLGVLNAGIMATHTCPHCCCRHFGSRPGLYDCFGHNFSCHCGNPLVQ